MSHDDGIDSGSPEAGTEARRGHSAHPAASPADSAAPSADLSERDSAQRGAESEDSRPVSEVEVVEEILEGEIDDPRAAKLIQQAVHEWEGPLPPPAALAAYERTLPGAANRVLAMAERSLGIREAREQTIQASVDGQVHIETITAEADRDALRRGQYLATGVSALVAILSFAGMFLTPWAAVGFAVPLAQVAVALVRTVSDGSRKSDQEQSEPGKQIAEQEAHEGGSSD